MPRTPGWKLLSHRGVPIALGIIMVLGRYAAARNGVEQQAYERQQQGLVQLDRQDVTGSLHLFAEAYQIGHRSESLLAMAASELKRSRFGSAQLLLLHPTLVEDKLTMDPGWLGSLSPLATLTAQARQNLRKVAVTLKTVFHFGRARLLVDCRPLVNLKDVKDGGSGETPRLMPLAAELPYRSLRSQADSTVQCPLVGQQPKETAAQVQAIIVEQQRKLEQLEAPEGNHLRGLLVEELPATEFLLFLEPGPHSLLLIDKEGEFVPFYQRMGALPMSDQPVALELDLHQKSGVLQLRLIDEKTAAGGDARLGSDATSGGLGKHELQLKVIAPQHRTVESRRLQARNLQRIELRLPPVITSPGYTISADLAGWNFFPVSKSDVMLMPGQVLNLDLVFRPRPIYRKWNFWTYLSVGAVALAAVVAGGIEGYRYSQSMNCGSVNTCLNLNK